MLKNYLKVALRSLNKNRTYSIINILGLALGLTVTTLVFMFVNDETSYDKHWSDSENIYRTGIKANMMGQIMNAPVSPSPMAQSLRTEFIEIETATRIQSVRQEILVRYEENKIYIQKGVYADSSFFSVFDFEFVHGDPKTALTEKNSMVVTEETARKLFGDENAMGKVLNYDNRQDFIITGVVKEPSGHSHFHFDMFMASNHIENIWISNNYNTYFKIKEGFAFADFETRMNDNFLEKIAPDVERFLKLPVEEFYKQGNTFEYQTQAIQDIHLYSHMDWEIEQNGNILYVFVFIGIAILVMLIAGINFMNLSTGSDLAKLSIYTGIRLGCVASPCNEIN